jgi:hypothetical protein
VKMSKIFWMLMAACLAPLMAAGSLRAIDEPPPTNQIGQAATEILTPKDPAPPPKSAAPKAAVAGELGKYKSIIDRAPFRNSMVPQAAAGATPSAPSQLRLNGIIRIGEKVSAGIEDTVQRKSLILAVGRTEEGIEIQSIDELNQTVSLVYNGQPITLAMDKTPGMSGMPLSPQPGQPAGAPSPAGVQPTEVTPGNPPAPGAPQPMKRRRIIIPREK